MRARTRLLGWIAPLATGLAVAAAGRDAHACGGLFCSTANPVNQAAERIVFAHDESAGRVTAVIEILYQGSAESFAWILPVAGTPDVSVSTNALLNRLQQATNPTYQIQRTWPNDTCSGDNGFSNNADDSPIDPPPAVDSPESEGSVSVLASGSAGPYDYEVISVAAAPGADPAQEAIDWLTTNGYDTGATGPDLIRPYLMNGLNLLAVRLNKQSSVGSIRPIKIAYDSDEPMIPIRPTAVAANDDMGILVWVLGSARAVPFNYRTLELNEALIDWFNPQQSYNDVVIAAANETLDGQGFVTELARPTVDPVFGAIRDSLFPEQYLIADYRSNADTFTDSELIVDVANRFAVDTSFSFTGPFGAAAPSGRVSLDGVADVFTRNLTLPDGVNVADVIAAPNCYLEAFEMDTFYCNGQPAPAQGISLVGFDRTAFLTDVEELVIQPIEQTVQLFDDLPYMTRFYTTLSADEMNVDPVFAINSDLSDVSSQHSVTIEYEGCFGDTNGPWEADVGGRIVRGEDNTWPLTLANKTDDMPVNLRVLQLGASGSGEIYSDNNDIIEQLLGSQFGMSLPMDDGGDPGANDPMGMTPRGMGSSSCSFGGASASGRGGVAGLGALGLVLLGGLRRRRQGSPLES